MCRDPVGETLCWAKLLGLWVDKVAHEHERGLVLPQCEITASGNIGPGEEPQTQHVLGSAQAGRNVSAEGKGLRRPRGC